MKHIHQFDGWSGVGEKLELVLDLTTKYLELRIQQLKDNAERKNLVSENEINKDEVINNLIKDNNKEELEALLKEWSKPWNHYNNPFKSTIINCIKMAIKNYQ